MQPEPKKATPITTIVMALAITALLNGCGTLPDRLDHRSSSSQETGKNDHQSNTVKTQLYAQHKAWKGVRYQLGGLSKKGIDCSGFVSVTFKEQFGITLPRTTRQQAQKGLEIPRTQLKAGDLVFFKTSLNVRHVGIYIESGKFLHASTSRGVMISNINNNYWRKRYWKATRL